MPKHVPDAAMNTVLDYIAGSTRMDVVLDAELPTGISNSLANVSMASGDFSQDTGDGGAGSRKVTMAAKTGVTVTADGTPEHVVLTLTGTIRLITTCSGPDLTETSLVDFPAWKYEIGAPT